MAESAAPSAPRTVVTLVRHGESNVTVARVIGGVRSCSGLSALGRRQAERLRDRLRSTSELDADVLLTSDFPRAIETAELIRSGFGERIVTGEIEQWGDLGEHDPGPDIDGMTFTAYLERFGTPAWSSDPDVVIFPGGETVREFHARVERGLIELRRRFVGQHVVVVCHGGVIDAAFRLLLGLPGTGGFELHTLNTALTTLSGPSNPAEGASSSSTEAAWRLERYNDVAHLTGLPAETPRAS